MMNLTLTGDYVTVSDLCNGTFPTENVNYVLKCVSIEEVNGEYVLQFNLVAA